MGDSSDDEDDEHFPVLGEWREEGFRNPVVQDIRCPEFEYRVNEVIWYRFVNQLRVLRVILAYNYTIILLFRKYGLQMTDGIRTE